MCEENFLRRLAGTLEGSRLFDYYNTIYKNKTNFFLCFYQFFLLERMRFFRKTGCYNYKNNNPHLHADCDLE